MRSAGMTDISVKVERGLTALYLGVQFRHTGPYDRNSVLEAVASAANAVRGYHHAGISREDVPFCACLCSVCACLCSNGMDDCAHATVCVDIAESVSDVEIGALCSVAHAAIDALLGAA